MTEFDERAVVVIGSGPSGASAARELVRNKIPVVLLDSGGPFEGGLLVRIGGRNLYRRTPAYGISSHGSHVASGDPKTAWWSSRALGGMSNQWTGAVPRFAPEDFTEGERIHPRYRWPITYEDLAPHYTTVEKLLRITAADRDVTNLPAGNADYHRELPKDWKHVAAIVENSGQGLVTLPLADGPPNMVVRRGTAFNSYTGLVKPLLQSPHFKLITNAHALRLEWNPIKGQVDGVAYHDKTSQCDRRISAAAVVVACGPLDSTRLLFSSACTDFPDGLGNGEGILGRYLHDHPREWWVFDMDKPISSPCPAVYLTRAPYYNSPPLMSTSWTIGAASLKDKLYSFLPVKTHSASVQIFGTMVPKEEHYVRPHDDQKDVYGQPKLDICIRYDEETICNVIKGRSRLLGLMAEAGYNCRPRAIVPQLFPGTSVHYGGTVRMHASQKYGMLDSWNRLWDAPNVLVVDASCFTTGPEKNPTLTAMAIATRAAAKLARDLKCTN